MTFERRVAGLFAMDDAAWKRHANPWSVLLRFTVLPALILAFLSRVYLGGWAAVLVALALLWTWLNPRVFPAPASFGHWASRAVLGERVWLNRDTVPIPTRHRVVPNLLSLVAGTGMLVVRTTCSSSTLSRLFWVQSSSTWGNSGSSTGWPGSGRT